MQKKAKTLSDIARLAGVSDSTASRALNNNALISEKTRELVQSIAKEHGYRINTAARNLRLQRTQTIAVVLLINSDQDQSVSDPFILSILGVIADELNQRGYDLLLGAHRDSIDDIRHHYFDSRRVDGMIVFGQGDNTDELVKLVDEQYPIAVWGEKDSLERYVSVGTDNQSGGFVAAQHLIERGCQRILFAGQLSFEIGRRYAGTCDALRQAGLPVSPQLDIHFSYEDAYQVVSQHLQQGKFEFDGVVAASDSIALGTIRALTEHGYKVPEQVAVVGYDDISVAAFTQPALSTVRQDTAAGGKHLVESLFAQMEKRPTASVVMPSLLVERDSSQLGKIS